MRVVPVSPRHAHVSQDELWEECQIESDENNHGGKSSPGFRIQPSCYLRPPEMHPPKEPQDRAAHHYVMEVRDNEIGIVHVNVEPERPQEHTRQSANRKQADKP